MQAEQTVIELTYDVLCREEVVEHPLLAERTDIRPKNRRSVRSEVAWLVNSDENVFELEGFEFEIPGLAWVTEAGRVERVVRVPVDETAV